MHNTIMGASEAVSEFVKDCIEATKDFNSYGYCDCIVEKCLLEILEVIFTINDENYQWFQNHFAIESYHPCSHLPAYLFTPHVHFIGL